MISISRIVNLRPERLLLGGSLGLEFSFDDYRSELFGTYYTAFLSKEFVDSLFAVWKEDLTEEIKVLKTLPEQGVW